MSKLLRVTGKTLIAALSRTGFIVIRIKGSHHFCSIQMEDVLLFLFTPGKLLALVSCRKFFAIVK